MTNEALKTQENTKRGGCCLHRLARRCMKRLFINSFLLDVRGKSTAEQRWWLRGCLRYCNHWPKTKGLVRFPKPRIPEDKNSTKSFSVSLTLQPISVQSGNMLPTQGCKMQSSAGQGCEWATNLWKAITELQRQNTPHKGPLQTPLYLLVFPCSPNDKVSSGVNNP
jgi:hypothetical protein